MRQAVTGLRTVDAGRQGLIQPGRKLVVAGSITGLVSAFACWQLGAGSWLLFLLIATLNTVPVLLDARRVSVDLLSPKNLFLGYFFVLLTIPAAYCLVWEGTLEPYIAVLPAPPDLRPRALAAILGGLSAFLLGAHIRSGAVIGLLIPAPLGVSRSIAYAVAAVAILSGVGAFVVLMLSSGGMQNFLAELGSWRTIGVSGIGHIIVPITTAAPAGCLLLLIFCLPPSGTALSCRALIAIILSVASLAPIGFLGFRIALVPVILQYLLVWHLRRKSIRFWRATLLAGVALVLAVAYSNIRESSAWGGEIPDESKRTYLYRVSGLETVERVLWHLDQEGPIEALGARRAAIEALSIIVPRSLWRSKPEPSSLIFVDTFFFDYFINRGDSITAVRSGVSATIIGELLGTGGIPAVLIFSLFLGVFATALTAWQRSSANSALVMFVYITLVARFPIFAEAVQNTANTMAVLTVLCVFLWIALRLPYALRRCAMGGLRVGPNELKLNDCM